MSTDGVATTKRPAAPASARTSRYAAQRLAVLTDRGVRPLSEMAARKADPDPPLRAASH